MPKGSIMAEQHFVIALAHALWKDAYAIGYALGRRFLRR